ncbi:DUF3667 domain-containing protein [Rubrivirga sp. S365]|uniref:DUF3667 domain-containing protein n=1 Tax=Rubrivirga litoralis TaxID=3075598 RepID=A0ABU3BTL9_9BACT|nr:MULTISPECIES: DUF3667 domain-containing protein [unclassified Rubrivirga]MDT0632585.1 DUF3667 domain-containing protein [Rubrivirga sp. F394]MDT7856725.1 DUF3667 domain-containing protein [Rubrivirga sp. S365]
MIDTAPPALAATAGHPVPERDVDCLQCGAGRVGAYCHACGQHESVADRLTFRSLWHDFRVRRLNLDRGLGRTLLDVVLRPGYVARAFVEGRRQTYTHPITLLFVLYAVYAVVAGLLDEPLQAVMRAQMEAQMPAGDEMTSEMDDVVSVMSEVVRVLYTYGAYFSVLVILPFAGLLRWLLGDRGRTVAEYAVFAAYVEAAVVLPSALVLTPLMALTGLSWIGMLSFVLYLVYAVWGVAQFVDDRHPGTLALAGLSMTVALVFYFGLFMVAAFSYGIYIAIQAAHAAG